MGGNASDITGKMEISQLVMDTRADFVFKVGMPGGHKNIAWFSKEYILQLTGSVVNAEAFVAKSFDFLAANQAVGKMPAEFEFTQIQRFYPAYESTMKAQYGVASEPAATPPAGTPPPAV